MVIPAGFEPTACRLGGDRSILLSYGTILPKTFARAKISGFGNCLPQSWHDGGASPLSGILLADTFAAKEASFLRTGFIVLFFARFVNSFRNGGSRRCFRKGCVRRMLSSEKGVVWAA